MTPELEEFLREVGLQESFTPSEADRRAKDIADYKLLPTTDEHGEYLF